MSSHMLIVEDDNFLGKLLAKKMEKAGFAVSEFKTGVDVVETAMAEQPDMILLDLIMPEKDGFAVLEELRTDAKTQAIPVVVVSALADDKDIQKAKGLGATEYFVKSNVELADIEAYVKKVIG